MGGYLRAAIPVVLALTLVAPARADEIILTRAELAARLATVSAPGKERTAVQRTKSLQNLMTAPPGDARVEYLLREDLLALDLPLSGEARLVVEALSMRPASIFVWHEEGGHARVAETELDVSAAARWVLRQSDIHATAEALRGNTLSPLARKPTLMADATRHLVANLPEAELPAHLPALEAAFIAGAPFEDALMLAAIRSNDISLALRIIQDGEATRLRRHLKPLHAHFADQAEILLTGVMQSSLAPHALALLAEHMTEDWAWQKLLRALDDDHYGATAALAIARRADNAHLAVLAQRLDTNPATASRAALALQINNSGYARQLLEEFSHRAGESELAGRIRSWSRD